MSESFPQRLADFATALAASAKSLIKMALQTRPVSFDGLRPANDSTLYILGNGPALRSNLDNNLDLLCHVPTLAVNFAANSPEFNLLKPRYYVLADPHFFRNTADPNVTSLLKAINGIQWPMTLFIPASASGTGLPVSHGNLRVERFNFVAAEGFETIENFAFNRALAMPRPRNVLIPSIMIAIWLGYKDIYLLGADHSWLHSLWVDDENRVVTVQPHFYADNAHEKDRVHSEYAGYHLHDVLKSMQIAFQSYHRIARFAALRGVNIFNATPGSFIDAFPRKNI